MEPYLVYLGTALAGGICGTVVPYVLKVWEDSSIKFDMKYFYSLCASVVASVAVLIPDTGVVDFKTAFAVFMAAYGLNTVANKATSTLTK